MGDLTVEQLTAISAIEWACSVLSLLGCAFTIVTFCSSRAFHKPINRLVFYASFGNMMSNVGTLMSRAYVSQIDSFGCQFQAFLIQLFMPADAFWILTMAINVYLTFYYKFDAERLRKMEMWYLLACYGIPFVPAFVFIFVKNQQGQRIYGNATLWCWVSPDHYVLRLATFYGPVWVTILITFFIYIRAGRTIYEKRKQLHGFHSSDPDPLSINGEAVATIKRTDIIVVTEAAGNAGAIHLGPMGRHSSAGDNSQGAAGAYSVHISAENYNSSSADEAVLPIQGRTVQQTSTVQVAPHRPSARRRNHELNNAAWSYTKCAMLFFTAILITWIPSSANRVYSVVNDNDNFIPLEFMSAFVLPLQGFWNAVIYAVMSWGACKTFFGDLRINRRPAVSEIVGGASAAEQGAAGHQVRRSQFKSPARSFRTYESESMTELAKPRTTSLPSLEQTRPTAVEVVERPNH
ncbi:G-protein coupled receptor 1 [Tolypocladium paradoxum]|uniref:G-protein coupled receptor 1 n=1 Tax=Tolypocladium paradoxum TaxID=94208 RepID=A0A2S4KZZ0_9HYPO|nr:G-protein coupled receptor 1 [Tolypocladium paradoxum]